MAECVTAAARYLEAERALGRVDPAADLTVIAPMLVSAVQLLFTDADAPPPQAAVARTVAAALAGAAPR